MIQATHVATRQGQQHPAVSRRPSRRSPDLKAALKSGGVAGHEAMDDEQLRSRRGGDMEYRVLGQVEALRDGRQVALGSFKQRSLLALLLIHANEVVSTDRIIDELWGDELVPGRQNALWVHVSNLRSALEPDRERRSEGTILLTRCARLHAPRRPEASRRRAASSSWSGGPAAARPRSGGGVDRARRGSRSVAWAPVRRLRLRVVRPGRDRPARGAPLGGRRVARRRRPSSRTGRRAGRRAGEPRRASTRCGSASPHC